MPRHHASTVLARLSILLSSSLLKRPPPAYQALLTHPPAPLPLQRPVPRPDNDLPLSLRSDRRRRHPSRLRRPQPIAYPELDALRRAFLRDHPFEAYRPISLVETETGLLHRLRGDKLRAIDAEGNLSEDRTVTDLAQWEHLAQKTRIPSADDCISFAYSLHVHHRNRYPLQTAYSISVSQFRTLRSESHLSSSFARQEAESYGARWSPSFAQRGAELGDRWLRHGRDKPFTDKPAAEEVDVGEAKEVVSTLEKGLLGPVPRDAAETFTGGSNVLSTSRPTTPALQ